MIKLSVKFTDRCLFICNLLTQKFRELDSNYWTDNLVKLAQMVFVNNNFKNNLSW